MSRNNSSRFYHLSNDNMSDIKQKIQEQYSMNFEKESRNYGQSKQQISEMIQSGSHSNVGFSRSRYDPKISETPHLPHKTTRVQIIPQEPRKQNNPAENNKKPIFLGEDIYNVIKERYHEFNPVNTDDPDVLYNFFLSQRKNFDFKNQKNIKQTLLKIKDLMPSMQRKAVVKAKFQNLLTYYPQDIYFTLCCKAQSIAKDRQVSQKINILNSELKKNQQKKHTTKTLQKTITRLYGPAINRQITSTQNDKINKFGKNLSQHFQNKYRTTNNVQSLQKLFNFWEDVYEREEYGIQWEQQTAKDTIKLYMKNQIETLILAANKKLGFKAQNPKTIYEFYKNNPQIQGVYIPLASFLQYMHIYNQFQKKGQEREKKEKIQRQRKSVGKFKQKQVKMFGRPVSATPLTILAKHKDNLDVHQLIQKYPKDHYIKNLILEEHLKKPRHANSYGIYNIQDQIKTKQRIKPKKQENMNQTMQKMKMGTMNFSQMSNFAKKDRIRSIFEEDYLESNENWKNLGPILSEAMSVKAFEEDWFRDCLLKYSQKALVKDYKNEDNKTIITAIIQNFDKMQENERKNQLNNLQSVIEQSEAISQKIKKIQQIKGNGNKQYWKQRQRCINMIQEKAKQHIEIKKKISNNQYDKDYMLRTYLNQFYAEILKECKDYAMKHFHITTIQKQCPKLLKFQLFRIEKQINIFTLERDTDPKSHAWIPPKKSPQSFNYKTYNQFGEFYVKNKAKIIPKSESSKQSNTIWGRKRTKDRQMIMMTYSDAKNCTFHPTISKKIA